MIDVERTSTLWVLLPPTGGMYIKKQAERQEKQVNKQHSMAFSSIPASRLLS